MAAAFSWTLLSWYEWPMRRVPGEKYQSELGFRLAQLRRLPIRSAISRLVRWKPLEHPRDGYTIIIGCNTGLARMLGSNLKFLSRQNLPHVAQIFVVLDRPRASIPDDIEPVMRARFPELPLEFLYYNRLQRAVCSAIRWPWVQSWLSWSIGIEQLNTQYALLHDFDAMLLRPNIIEERFLAIRERKHEYVGVRFYSGNGVAPEDGLATTFELIFDAQFVRRRFVPLDLFNHVVRFRGKRVDFDTLLYAQSIAGKASTLEVAETDMVHPSQLICHFEGFLNGRDRVPPANNLLMVPYLLFASDEPAVMQQMTQALEQGGGSTVPFFGKSLDLSGIDPPLLRWLAKQAGRLEQSDVGHVRDEVTRYFTAADKFIARATGRQQALGGPPEV